MVFEELLFSGLFLELDGEGSYLLLQSAVLLAEGVQLVQAGLEGVLCGII